MLTVRDGDPIRVDLGRVGQSVSKKKMVDRAIKRTPARNPADTWSTRGNRPHRNAPIHLNVGGKRS